MTGRPSRGRREESRPGRRREGARRGARRRAALPLVPLVVAALAVTRCTEDTGPPVRLSADGCALSAAIDGDSVRCADGREIRLLSIDAPEIAQDPWGSRSREALLARAPIGTDLGVEYDIERRDGFGRDLAYLYLPGGEMLNERLVADGFALAFIVRPNQRYETRIRSAEDAARAADRGLWSEWGFTCRPVDFRAGRCGS